MCKNIVKHSEIDGLIWPWLFFLSIALLKRKWENVRRRNYCLLCRNIEHWDPSPFLTKIRLILLDIERFTVSCLKRLSIAFTWSISGPPCVYCSRSYGSLVVGNALRFCYSCRKEPEYKPKIGPCTWISKKHVPVSRLIQFLFKPCAKR